ncbi:MAG: filamentous hemagglutinin N-terminal domain-containing protein, partial [Alphaproteobacteria bacterium]|nr:filamentous hemagglutinin N-terminal domain-containing protein [Alphaproteobacteria bacterium]
MQNPLKSHVRRGFRFPEIGVSLAALLAMGAAPAVAAPVSGSFEAGKGEIIRDGLTTTVVQNSARAVVGWQSFDLAPNETVEFIQPEANSAILNRIMDSNPSRIAGTVIANGAVYFVNPNGMIFEASSRVTANGFVASTVAASNFDFINGRGEVQSLVPGPVGNIILNGSVAAATIVGLGGGLAVNGSLDAASARGVGGTISLSAVSRVPVGETAVISARGAAGGGSSALGGNFRGAGA